MNTPTNYFESRRAAYAVYLSKLPVLEREKCINRLRTDAQRARLRDLIYKVKAEQLLTLPVTLLACALKQLEDTDQNQFKAVSSHLNFLSKGTEHGHSITA